jgi:hypothetical protein
MATPRGVDKLGTGQWQWVIGSSRRERGISGEDVKWMQFSPWKGLVESPGWYQCDREVTTGPLPKYLSLYYLNHPPTAIGRFLAYPRLVV